MTIKDQISYDQASKIYDSLVSQLGGVRPGTDKRKIILQILDYGYKYVPDPGVWADRQNVQTDISQDLATALYPYRLVKSNNKTYIPQYKPHKADNGRSKATKELITTYLKEQGFQFKSDPSYFIDKIAAHFTVDSDDDGTPKLSKLYKGMFSKGIDVADVVKSNLGHIIDEKATQYKRDMENSSLYVQLAYSKYGRQDMSKEEFEKIKEYATEIKNYHSLPKTDKKVNREEQFLYKMAMEKRAAFDLDIADMTKMSMEQQSAIKQKADYELKNMNDPKIPEDAGFEPL